MQNKNISEKEVDKTQKKKKTRRRRKTYTKKQKKHKKRNKKLRSANFLRTVHTSFREVFVRLTNNLLLTI